MFVENILLALNSLKSNKMRAILTMLGIIIGIGSVIAIMTVGDSVKSSVANMMSDIGASNILVSLQERDEDTEYSANGAEFGKSKSAAAATEDDYYTVDMIQALCDKYPNRIKAISASETVGSDKIEYLTSSANVSVVGVSMGYFLGQEMDIAAGSYFTEEEADNAAQVAMVSDQFVENLYGGDNDAVLGKTINVHAGDQYVDLTIVGVYKYEQSMTSYSSETDSDTQTDVYIPIKLAKSITHTTGYSNFMVVPADASDSEALSEDIGRFLGSYYRDNDDFEPLSVSMERLLDALNDMMSTVTLAIAAIAAIALIVGGIGVMNIMLVSITERTREIGTRKALGAKNSYIRLQFIVEAIIICLVGGIIGIILGVALGIGVSHALGYPATPSVLSIVISIVFSMAVGVFFGYYPANKAAKMNPIDALRYE